MKLFDYQGPVDSQLNQEGKLLKAEKFAKRSVGLKSEVIKEIFQEISRISSVEMIVAPYEADSKLAMWMGSLQKTQISLSSGCNKSYLTSIWMLKNCCCLKEKISQKSNPTITFWNSKWPVFIDVGYQVL